MNRYYKNSFIDYSLQKLTSFDRVFIERHRVRHDTFRSRKIRAAVGASNNKNKTKQQKQKRQVSVRKKQKDGKK